ncbi:MAG: alpha/beta hydrolase fold domain-containing protein, partial [Verrucomicrobiota bacterium]
MMKVFSLAVCILLIGLSAVAQNKTYPPKIEGAKEHIYKTIDDVDMKLWVFHPESTDEPVPAMLFFFGGGWSSGSPSQFVGQSEHLAKRGMAGIVVDYRVKSRHGVQAKDCVADASDALKYVTENAESMGIDPERIGVGGGSAGGHLAGCLGTVGANESFAPKAMALFNPAVVLAPIKLPKGMPAKAREMVEAASADYEKKSAELTERMGVDPKELSPFHQAKKNS